MTLKLSYGSGLIKVHSISPLNIAGGRSPEGYVCLSTGGCNITDIIKEAEKKGMKENPWSDYVDYKKVVEVLLENKEMLPAFMGIDKNFDKIIAEKLKEKNNG